MDLQKLISDVLDKLKNDKDLAARFDKDPTAVLEKLIGIDLPNDQLNAVIEGVKAKLKLDDVADKLGGVLNFFKK
ncbi:MAG: hypothetical protein IJ507_08810 [Clostridia bacterium]|nr:hypothetical protein [Clostridia bacterium]